MNLDPESYLVFDGAMGTMLQKYEVEQGQTPEIFNIAKPEIVEKIHKEYIAAGSDVITANTFGAIEDKLLATGYSVEEVVHNAIKIARKAAGKKKVALDIGPTGKLLEPFGDLSFQKAYDLFVAPVKAGAATGELDLVLIETFFQLMEAEAAIKAVKDNSSLPVICTLTFEKQGKTLMGDDVKKVVGALEEYGADAIGINCSLGPKELLPIVQQMLTYTKLPVLIQPNAGLPEMKGEESFYNVSPQEFAKYIKEMAMMGVKWFGGCCGTTPEYISEIKKVLQDSKGFF